MHVHYLDKIEGNPVVSFIGRAWVILMQEGLWDKTSVLVSPELQCVYAVDKRKILGCLTFHVDDGEAVINIAFVRSEFRGKGIYRAMHDLFLQKSKEQGARQLVNICYPTNTAIRETCAKMGYTLRHEHWIKEV